MEHVALITGAGRGIGAAIARYLAARDVGVIVGARTLAECEAVASELTQTGGRAFAVELDVTRRDSIESAIAAARTAFGDVGPVDWLVNNAGMAVSAPLLNGEETDALFAKHLEVNLHGPRRMMEALLPDMIERGRGSIANVASSAALQGYAYVSAYAASKHALLGYSRSAALELARTGVKVNTVCPHYVDSPMTRESIERVMEKTGRSREQAAAFFAEQNPGGRLVQPEEIAEAVHQLLSGEESGQLIELDGSDR